MLRHLRFGDGLLIGIDLKKDTDRLEQAYNDSQGFTKAFNLNILRRINRELGSDFDLGLFEHRAFYSHEHDRIEMHLVSRQEHTVLLAGSQIRFLQGESIHTESSRKYDPDEFAVWAAEVGFSLEKLWTDSSRSFGVLFLTSSRDEPE